MLNQELDGECVNIEPGVEYCVAGCTFALSRFEFSRFKRRGGLIHGRADAMQLSSPFEHSMENAVQKTTMPRV